jgi:hypothetical protein
MLVTFSPPEFNLKKQISWPFHADDRFESSNIYDMIIGRDLLGVLGIIMSFNDHTVTWDTDTIPMKDRDIGTLSSVEALIEIYMIANEPQTLRDEYSRATKIVDADFKSASLDDVIKTCENHHVEEQHQPKELLQKYEHLFDGTLGEFNMDPISLQLMDPNCKPIHARAYTVPRSVDQQLQQSKEIVRLVDIGVLEEDYSSEWASISPSFAIPKKNVTMRVVSDFRKLNLLLKRHPFPIQKIGNMIRSMEGFTFASALDLNIGYYHIKLVTDDDQTLCTIVFPWKIGNYKYKRLPMVIKIA